MTQIRTWMAAGALLLALGASARGDNDKGEPIPTGVGTGLGLSGCSAPEKCSADAPAKCCPKQEGCPGCCRGKTQLRIRVGTGSAPCQETSGSCCPKCCQDNSACPNCALTLDCLSLVRALLAPRQLVVQELLTALRQAQDQTARMPHHVPLMMVAPFGCPQGTPFSALPPLWVEQLPAPRPLATGYAYPAGPGSFAVMPPPGIEPGKSAATWDMMTPCYGAYGYHYEPVVQATAAEAVKSLVPCVTELAPTTSCGPSPASTWMAVPPTPPCPWTLSAVDGKAGAKLEIRCGCDTCMTCESLTLSVPGGKPLQVAVAEKQVHISGAFLTATADRLVRSGHDDRVALEGHVRLKYDKDGQRAEVAAENVIVGLAQGDLEVMPKAPAGDTTTAVQAEKGEEGGFFKHFGPPGFCH